MARSRNLPLRVARWTDAALFALVAAACIVRGMIRLLSTPAIGGGSAFGGMGAALGYFALGVLALLIAGEICPEPAAGEGH